MLDKNFVRDNLDEVKERLKTRTFQMESSRFLELDREGRSARSEWEELRAFRNRASKEIAEQKKESKDVSLKIKEMKQVSARIKELDELVKATGSQLNDFLAGIPNLPHPTVPIGSDDTGNIEVRRIGQPANFDFPVKDHVALGAALGILDVERASKIAGARFANYYGAGALLERALMNFMLEIQTREHGYIEVLPPFLANSSSLFGTGNFPKFKTDLFSVEDTDYFLIPTAEVPLTNIFAGEVLTEDKLPKKFAAHTPCFRSEAGSYGKDTRGLIRQHQFNKVELVKFSRPEDSYEELEKLTSDAEEILSRLELPYRVMALCTGDMGFSAAKTYDLEVWVPSQGCYREISSCSNFEDFQARRANIRYKPEKSHRTSYVHTLNGSGLAIGRTWLAIIENFQQANGTIRIPSALRPYMYGMQEISVQDPLMD
jgi:seryl-tRNA synthetase